MGTASVKHLRIGLLVLAFLFAVGCAERDELNKQERATQEVKKRLTAGAIGELLAEGRAWMGEARTNSAAFSYLNYGRHKLRTAFSLGEEVDLDVDTNKPCIVIWVPVRLSRHDIWKVCMRVRLDDGGFMQDGIGTDIWSRVTFNAKQRS